MSPARDMKAFWDARARENPLFFIDNRLAYESPDSSAFWVDGEADLDFVLDSLGIAVGPEDTVLEIGCGIGRLTRPLADRAAGVVALDVSTEMLALARRHNPHLQNVTWVAGDGTSLSPVEDLCVDVCFSHVVFQHIPDPAITLGYVREMGRVLRPGGWAAFQLSTDPRLHAPRSRRLRERLRAGTCRAPRGTNDPRWLGSAVDVGELEQAAADGAMQIDRVENPGTQLTFVLARRRKP